MRKAILVAVSCFEMVAGTSRAQAPAEGGAPVYPISTSLLPLESAFLRSRLDFQIGYSSVDFSAGPFSASVNALYLAIDGRYALADRFEIGLNVPFLVHAWGQAIPGAGSSDSEFGNLSVNLKFLLVGSSGGPIALSLYLNTLLPTATGLRNRSFALLQDGLAVSSHFGKMFTVGGSLGVLAIVGGSSIPAALSTDLFFGVSPIRIFAAQLGVQLLTPINPSTDSPGVGLTPAVQLYPIPMLHIDLGVRIAANDNGKLYSLGGRAALVFSVGLVMP